MKIILLILLSFTVNAGDFIWHQDNPTPNDFGVECELLLIHYSDQTNTSNYNIRCISLPVFGGITLEDDQRKSTVFMGGGQFVCPIINAWFTSDPEDFYIEMDCRTIIFKNGFE